MIEVALSLAIIGFALVAIIAILPLGMNVQKENREETIINQDYTVWLDALRGGSRGYDDLTNYVLGITNSAGVYTRNGNTYTVTYYTNVYTRTLSLHNGTSITPPVFITNGAIIVGLMSTPRYEATKDGFVSNHMVAIVRAMSGLASDKYPQTNQTLLESAFTYRLITDVLPYVPVDPTQMSANPSAGALYSRYVYVSELESNAWDLRMTFRWPVYPNGQPGSFRQSYQTMIGGYPQVAYWPPGNGTVPLYFFQPSLFTNAVPH
jgi:type II secretory pathway pseudopilin PulG